MPIGEHRFVRSHSHGRLLTAAAKFASLHSELVVILPSRSAGEELAHRAPGVLGLHRLTLLQLAADLARPAMAERKLAPLTPLGLEALSARVVHAALAERELAYFKPVAALPGFARALARTIGELRGAGVPAEDLASAGAPGADLARLLRRYQDELEHCGLADTACVFQLAIDAARSAPHRLVGLPVVLLDAPLETALHREFFAALARRAPALLAAVSSREERLAAMLDLDVEDLDADSEALSELEHLRKYLFSVTPPAARVRSGALQLFSAPGEGLEAVEIARRILQLAREGVAFDQVAILLRSPERYQPTMEEALRRARIPAYFSRGTARPDAGGRAFLALLACASERCSASRFAEYLSLGQLPPPEAEQAEWVPPDQEMLNREPASETEKPEPEEPVATWAPAGWEKLLVDAAVIGGRDRWRRRLRGLAGEFELRLKTLERDDDARRDHLARQLAQLRELERFALPLIDVIDALPAAAPWREWIAHLSNLARKSLRRAEQVLAVLAEFEPMGDVGPATLEEVAEVLSDRLRFLRRDPPERRYGRVFVGSIDEARGREFEVVFLPGLAEGLFPQKALEDPLLLDHFRKAVDTALPLRDDRVDQERIRLHLAVGAARDRLIASYPRMDVAEARPRVPSFYALELPRAIEGTLPGLKDFESRARDAASARLNWPAPKEVEDAIDDAEYDLVRLREAAGARYLVETNEHLARSLRARWKRWEPKWTAADGLITADPAARAVLSQHRLGARAWSPSSLQNFAVCPYKFALHGIYGLRPREEAVAIERMDPLTRGALFHQVQFALLGELKKHGLLPVGPVTLAPALTLADQVLDQVAAKYEEDLVPAIPRVWKSEIEDLRTDLRGWLQHIAANDDDWEPIHFEFAFGLPSNQDRDPASTLDEADLAGVRLRGSIDLIERHTTRGVLRVTDHKTGKPPEMIPAFVGGGRFLQPVLYALAAEKLLGAPVESGRLFYSTQQGGYQPALIQITDRARGFLGKLLANIDGAIAEGFLSPVPQKDACEICDYRIVCGPYESLRATRYKDRGDERLDPLTEVRGMA